MIPHPSVSGRVFDAAGNPAKGLLVTARRDVFDSGTGAETFVSAGSDTTNTARACLIESLPPGRYYLNAGPADGFPDSQAETAEEGGTVVVRTFHPERDAIQHRATGESGAGFECGERGYSHANRTGSFTPWHGGG